MSTAAPPPTTPTTPPAPADPRSTGEVLRSVVDTSRALVKKEIELAKLEMQEIVTARLVAAGLAVTAGMVGLFVLAFVGVTVASALQEVWAPWLAWLVVTVGYALVMGLLLAGAYYKATRPPNRPERTQRAAEETITWARVRMAPYTGDVAADRSSDGEVAP